jgi:hypothetical protein
MFDTGARPALVAISAREGVGIVLVEFAERYGATRQSLQLAAALPVCGKAGLADCSKRPRTWLPPSAPRAGLRVIELRREHPSGGPRRLAYESRPQGEADPVPSRSSIHQIPVRSGSSSPGNVSANGVSLRNWPMGRDLFVGGIPAGVSGLRRSS